MFVNVDRLVILIAISVFNCSCLFELKFVRYIQISVGATLDCDSALLE